MLETGTEFQIMTGIHGYHRLLRELYYRPENGVSEALFRRIVGVTGPRFLITSNLNSCGISADTTRRQTGGLLWDRGAWKVLLVHIPNVLVTTVNSSYDRKRKRWRAFAIRDLYGIAADTV